MARIYAPNESYNCDYGVDFFNGAAAVPDADTATLAWFTAKGYTVVEGKDALTFWDKLSTVQLLEFATEQEITDADQMTKSELITAIETLIATIAEG